MQVSNGFFTTPLTAAQDVRTGQQGCPANSNCVNGIAYPHVRFTDVCTVSTGYNSFSGTVSLAEDTVGDTEAYPTIDINMVTQAAPTATHTITGCSGATFTRTTTGTKLSLTSSSRLDFETCRFFTIALELKSGGTGRDNTFSCALRVNIVNGNDRPTLAAGQVRQIAEDSPKDFRVGLPLNWVEEDVEQDITFSIVTGDTSLWSVGTCNGQLYLLKPELDYETTNQYTIRVRATDSGTPSRFHEQDVVIQVVNVNEAPRLLPQVFTIDENAYGTLTPASPPYEDEDTPEVLTWSIVTNDQDGKDSTRGAFQIDSSTGVISVAPGAEMDYETKSSFRIEVRVIDDGDSQGNNRLQATRTYDINVIDKNDPPRVPSAHVYINEQTVSSSTGLSLVATDQDTVSGSSVTFSVNNTLFSVQQVSPQTGTLMVATADTAALDFETMPEIQVELTVSDNGTPPLSSTSLIWVHLQNVNERPVIPASQVRQVRESAQNGQTFDSGVVCTDVDVGDSLFYELDDNAGGRFSINPTSGVLSVLNAALLDFETSQSHTIRVKCGDTGSPPLSTVQDVTVTVLDVNEPPTFAAQARSIPENTAGSSAVGAPVAGVDQDAGQTATLQYAIVGGSGQALFTVDQTGVTRGQIRVAAGADLNFEKPGNPFTVEMEVSDEGSPSLKGRGVVTITLTDVQEDPWFPFQMRGIEARSTAGALVGSPLGGRDEDAGQQATLTYAIDSTSAHSAQYELASATGQLSLKIDAPDVPTQDQYTNHTLTIKVTDTTGREATGTMVVQVFRSNAKPVMTMKLDSHPEDTATGSLLHTMVVTDANSDQTHVWAVEEFIPTEANALVSLDRDSGEVRTIAPLDHETLAFLALRLLVTDSGVGRLSDVGWYNLTITNVNEPPVMTPLNFTIAENSDVDVVVGALTAVDQDVGDTQTWSVRALPGSTTDAAIPFKINAASGQLAVSKDELDFELGPRQYWLEVTVADSDMATDIEMIMITVTDVNEAPTLSPVELSIAETDSLVCCGTATDPDNAGFMGHGKLTYKITGGSPAPHHFILLTNENQPADISVQVADGIQLDYENITEYTLQVTGTDNPSVASGFTALSDSTTITIKVLNRADVTISSVDTLGTAYSTAGGDQICFNGTNMGWTATNPKAGDVTQVFTAQYSSAVGFGSSTTKDAPGQCTREVANTRVCCTTGEGIGRQYWRIKATITETASGKVLSDDIAQAGTLMLYAPPVDLTIHDAAALPTVGGARFTIKGKNFGPVGALDDIEDSYVTYGPSGVEFRALRCNITVAHVEMQCWSVPGNSSNLQFKVTVSGRTSAAYGGGASHAAPSIEGIEGSLVSPTAGSAEVFLVGKNFGQVDRMVTAQYGQGRYTVQCRIITVSRVRCLTAPGTGKDYAWTVTSMGLTSAPSTTTTRYASPAILIVQNAQALSTSGNEEVRLLGSNFGPFIQNGGAAASDIVVRYGDAPGLQYTALSCQVITPHSEMMCLSAEGVGRGHSWQVTIDDQISPVLDANTAYRAPIITGYEGPGVTSRTEGGLRTTVLGLHFGSPGKENIDRVTYSNGAFVFEGKNCSVVDHAHLECDTSPGVGDGLVWTVVIDGQMNQAPVTAYFEPKITGFSGAGSTGAATAGGQQVTVHGVNFGPPAGSNPPVGYGGPETQKPYPTFLDWVRYGPTGVEYQPVCSVVADDEMTCVTTAGVGASLVWTASVEGQVGPRSTVTFDYAAPRILEMSPNTSSTEGGGRIRVRGTNFGIEDINTLVYIRWNKQEALINTTAPRVVPASSHSLDTSERVHEVYFVLPSGWGIENTVEIASVATFPSSGAVTTTYSESEFFAYNPPDVVVTYATANPDGPGVLLNVAGSNFCNTQDCGRVFVSGQRAMNIREWTHTAVSVEMAEQMPEGSVTIQIEKRRFPNGTSEWYTETGQFVSYQPGFSGRLGQNIRQPFHTVGGGILEFEVQNIGPNPNDTVVTIGRADCPALPGRDNVCKLLPGYPERVINEADANATFIIMCVVPPGQGTENELVVQYLESRSPPSSEKFRYLPPMVYNITDMSTNALLTDSTLTGQGIKLNLTVPTRGLLTDVHGSDFGTVGEFTLVQPLTGDIQILSPQGAPAHTTARLQIPEGVGSKLQLWYDTGSLLHGDCADAGSRQGHRTRPNSQSYTPPAVQIELSYMAPTLNTSIAYSSRTDGNDSIVITGTNFGVDDVLLPTVTVGGQPCALINDGSRTHESVTCHTPPGTGRNHPIVLTVAGQRTVAPALLHYEPPRVLSVNPPNGNTSGGAIITITGNNFGSNPADAQIVLKAVDETGAVSGMDPHVTVDPQNILAYDHHSISFILPPGHGEMKMVVVSVNGQSSLSDPALASGQYEFMYDPPIIAGIQPKSCPTAGDCQVTISGNNFGTYVPGQALAKISLDALTGPVDCIVQTAMDHVSTQLRCTMGEGYGFNRTLTLQIGQRTAPTIQFSYSAPSVGSVAPNLANALGGDELRIKGENFGPANATLNPVEVLVDGLPCMNAKIVVAHALVTCTMNETQVGHKDLLVRMAGQTSLFSGSSDDTRRLSAVCPTGYFGQTGEYCAPCPVGANGTNCRITPECRSAVIAAPDYCAEPYVHRTRVLASQHPSKFAVMHRCDHRKSHRAHTLPSLRGLTVSHLSFLFVWVLQRVYRWLLAIGAQHHGLHEPCGFPVCG